MSKMRHAFNKRTKKELCMKFWLESLQQNGFDVFIEVYLALLFIGYHYLMRWFIKNEFKKQLDKLSNEQSNN